MKYPPIAEHGLIGDLQTSALVATDGTVDFFCCPRFDSPTVFASLLDHSKGGRFTLAPVGVDYVTKQMYLPDTAILITRYLSEAGVAEVVDYMPITTPEIATERHRLVRGIRGIRGSLDFEGRIEPRFDYGRQEHTLHLNSEGAVFEAPSLTLSLRSQWPLERNENDVLSRFRVHAGDLGGFLLESGTNEPPTQIGGGALVELFEETVTFWKKWVHSMAYHGRWREAVERSAITLKLMTYAPTGALVAAPTGGLPEQIGGERNWDYRYTWVRDGSFSVYALLGLGYVDEAVQFTTWLRDRITDAVDGGTPLNIMYRVDGTSDLDEFTLDHFEGYRGSSPVRIGNGAATQLQLDIYGEAMDSIRFVDQVSSGLGYTGWKKIVNLIDWLADHWQEPDEGIWETRGGRQPFVYGRLMSWVAFDRAIRMAMDRGRPGDVTGWMRTRDEIFTTIMTKGWNEQLQAFVQYEGSDVLDASCLLMPLVGFVMPQDPQWLSTLSAIDRTLVTDSLVHRYDPSASPDGLQGSEGTFSLCTFWYVDALARSGRLDEARLVFEKMLTYANHVGLYSEEIGATGEQLGNFPQAFTHLSLINAAMNLDYQLDHGAGRVAVVERGTTHAG
jgi:GH15 family glucan-1,4-alpha-glucosidase